MSRCATGTHEFADSVNNGPWGAALTTEFIPHLESKYRMDAKSNGRFLQGSFLRWMGHAPAAGQLPESFWRHLVYLTRSQRLPCLLRNRSLRASRQCLPSSRRHPVAYRARPRKGDGYARAARPPGARPRRLRRPACFIRVGLLASRRRWPTLANVQPRNRRRRSCSGCLLARSL